MNSPKLGRPLTTGLGEFLGCCSPLRFFPAPLGSSNGRSKRATRLSAAIGDLLFASTSSQRFAGTCWATGMSLKSGFRRGRPGLSRGERSATFNRACRGVGFAAGTVKLGCRVSVSERPATEFSLEPSTATTATFTFELLGKYGPQESICRLVFSCSAGLCGSTPPTETGRGRTR